MRAFVDSPVAFRAFSWVLLTAGAIGLSDVALSATAPTPLTGADGPWEEAVVEMCAAFTGIIGQGLSLIAIVIGGLLYAFGEGGSKSQIAGLVFGAGLVLQAHQFLTWVGMGAACPTAQVLSVTRFPRGEQEWEGFVQLAEPLQLMGVDRRAFFLSAMFSYVFYMLAGFLAGIGMFVVLLGSFRALGRLDPHIITVAQAAFQYIHTWYDYDSAPSGDKLGPVIDPPLDCWPHGEDRSFQLDGVPTYSPAAFPPLVSFQLGQVEAWCHVSERLCASWALMLSGLLLVVEGYGFALWTVG